MHGLNGYFEVIQTVEWGLKSLGHTVSYAVNSIDPDAINIVFGAQVLPISLLEKLPRNTIIYNFEQIRSLRKDEIRPEVIFYAERFHIWEYCSANLETWRLLNAKETSIVPVSYAPILTKIPKTAQDIDLLIYGTPGQKRLEAFSFASSMGLKVIFASGLYGDARDELISRAKIVMNVNLYHVSRIFEVVRVSYLLANSKAVVSIAEPNTYVEAGYENAVKFVEPKAFAETVENLLGDDEKRCGLENSGFDFFSKKDVRVALQAAIENI
jgi:hypothetical protein